MKALTEQRALTYLQRLKASYQSHIKLNYEFRANDCKVCPTAGICCTDAHFVNVHITRLEAIAIRETLAKTPRLNDLDRRVLYQQAKAAVEKYGLKASNHSFSQTYSCPLFKPGTGCLVHRRAKPSPCIQHACYENWYDLPPDYLQQRCEHRVEQLNRQVYGDAWDWLPIPLWLSLIDPASDGKELAHLINVWINRRNHNSYNVANRSRQLKILNSV
jgi:hypothetical protein